MLTALIATLNGENVLPAVLKTYCQIEPPDGGWKLVVVDNGSTDGTKDRILGYRDRLPLTYVFEPKLGKNNALNTALSHISGDLVVFTDDDIFPKRDWLSQLRRAADAHASSAIFAGVILPRWEVRPDDWIVDWVPQGVTFGLSAPTMTEGVTTPFNTAGGNMAIRHEIFEKGYRFDPRIGPRGAQYPIGSETQLVRRLVADGFSIWACTNAVVEHFIPRTHLQKAWILGRATRYGRGRYRLAERSDVPSLFGVPRYVIRSMLDETIKIMRASLRRDAQELFKAQWELSYLRGVAIEARILTREQPHRAS